MSTDISEAIGAPHKNKKSYESAKIAQVKPPQLSEKLPKMSRSQCQPTVYKPQIKFETVQKKYLNNLDCSLKQTMWVFFCFMIHFLL